MAVALKTGLAFSSSCTGIKTQQWRTYAKKKKKKKKNKQSTTSTSHVTGIYLPERYMTTKLHKYAYIQTI